MENLGKRICGVSFPYENEKLGCFSLSECLLVSQFTSLRLWATGRWMGLYDNQSTRYRSLIPFS